METEHRSIFTYVNKQLHFEGRDLALVLERFPSPLYLYSEKELKRNYLEFENAADSVGREYKICFALKSNPNRELLKILARMGAGADIVSGGELKRALESGIPAEKIVFSGVGKTEEEIANALEACIYSFNVESFEELKTINATAGAKGIQARVAFRLNPKVKAKTHKYISTGFKTHKFGILEEDILNSLDKSEYWSDTKLVGLSVHIGSQLTDLEATGLAVKAASDCAKKLPVKLEFIDVGGGLGVNYSKDQSPKAPSLDFYMAVIKENIDIGYPLKLVFEPGRRIVATAGVFISKVIRSKKSEDCNFLIVDGGMNDFARPSLYEAYHEILPSRQEGEEVATDIVGPICETADCFGEKRMMPMLASGDFVAIADTGAYGYSMSSNYNLRSRPLEVLLTANGELRAINRRQGYGEI